VPPDAAAEAATRHLRAGGSGRSRSAWARSGRSRPAPKPLQASMRPEQSIAGDALLARNQILLVVLPMDRGAGTSTATDRA